MLRTGLSIHRGLFASGRVPAVSRPGGAISALELLLLLSLGAVAALATVLLDFRLRIPGHAVLRSVFPMALGLVLVPRRFAGTIMGGSALATALLAGVARGSGAGAGALTSLSLTGPLLDLALWGAERGWRLYLGFVLAGLGSNLVALAVRGGLKALVPGSGSRPAEQWWASAPLTYPVCGILAGLVSAFVWFRFRRRGAPSDGEVAP